MTSAASEGSSTENPSGIPSACEYRPQSSVCDGVKRPPHHAAGHRIRAAVPLLCGQHHTSPIQHLARRPSGEGQQEDAFRRRSRREQPRHASRESGRLARSGARKDPERPTFMADGCELGLVELLHPGEHMFDSSGSGSFGLQGQPYRSARANDRISLITASGFSSAGK